MRLESILIVLLFPLWLGCAANVDTDSGGGDGGDDEGTSSSDSGSTTENGTTSSPAKVSTLEDASGNTLSISSTVSTCPSFCVSFSAAVDTTTCTTSTLTLSCNSTAVSGGSVVIPSDTDEISDNECCLNPTCPIPQASPCTFTVSGVKDKSGLTVSDGNVSVTTNCRSSDDFSTDTKSCYLFKNTTNQANNSETTKSAALTISNGTAVFQMNATNSQFETQTEASMRKEVTGDYDIQFTVKSMTVDNNDAKIKFSIHPKSETGGPSNSVSCGLHRNRCRAIVALNGIAVMDESDTACNQGGNVPGSFTPNATLRVVKSGSTYQCYRKLPNGIFIQIGSNQTQTSLASETNTIEIVATSYSTSGNTRYEIDDLTFGSGKANGQDKD